jgi:hypothetical protein
MPANRFRVSDPLFAQRIASLEQRSVFARARLEAIRRSGMRVWVVTPEALASLAPRAPRLPVAWVTLLEGGEDVVAVVDLQWLRRQHQADGRFSQDDFLRDLDLILGHELLVHIGSIGPGRDLSTLCRDPDPVPGALGCSVVQENLLTFSLDPDLPLRQEYRTLVLNTEPHAGVAGQTVQVMSAYFPELDERGWERTAYARFAEQHRLDTESEFQRLVRMLWENGKRERVEVYYTRMMEAVLKGSTQEAAEMELIEVVATPKPPSEIDRFRTRELELVRAGKHDHARALVLRRAELLTSRRGMTLVEASALALGEMAQVSLRPENFEEAIELLHRHGAEHEVRRAFARYLAELAEGVEERQVRERVFRELLPLVDRLNEAPTAAEVMGLPE